MEINKIFGVCIVFLIGMLSVFFISYFLDNGLEVPFVDIRNFDNISLGNFSFFNNSNKAPLDFINESQIEVYNDKVVIYIKDASLSNYASTGSMIPVLDKGSNGIRIEVESVDDINVGDIVSFNKDNMLIVHRVIEKGEDKKGVYFITKGDNNNISDGKIRFENIKYKTVGVIW